MKRIPTKSLQRPLQGNAYVMGYGNRPLRSQPTLIGSYQAAMDRANRANEQRYQQLLTGYDDLRSRVMGDLANVGQQEAADINRSYRNMASNVYNSLVNRGFGNGTLNATMQQGVERERAAQQGRLNDRLLQQRAAYDTNLSQGKFGVIERRTDAGPNLDQMIALAQASGRSGGGGFGGGFGGGGLPYMLPPTFNQDGFRSAYDQAMAQHLGSLVSGPMYRGRGGMPYANLVAQQNRLRRALNRRKIGEDVANKRMQNLLQRF